MLFMIIDFFTVTWARLFATELVSAIQPPSFNTVLPSNTPFSIKINSEGNKIAIDTAINNGINRLELEVSEKNKFAISLYEKLGFEVEGVKRRAFLVNGNYENELIMGKII